MPMTIVVDENALYCDMNNLEGLHNSFEKLSKLLNPIDGRPINREKRSTVWYAEILPGMTFYQLLFDEPNVLDHDIRHALQQQLDGITDWDEMGNVMTSRQWVMQHLENGEAYACFVLPQHDGVQGDIHAIGNKEGLVRFYQDAPRLGRMDEDAFIDNCTFAYPNLRFKPGLEKEIGRFSKKYVQMRDQLMAAMKGINQYLPQILVSCSGQRGCIQENFQAMTGFEISPESANTHNNPKAMRARDIDMDGKTLRCEWHLKIEPHRDRIHFFWKMQDNAPPLIVIGIFHEHLPV